MDYFSTNPAADALSRAKGEISEVKSVMVENIDKVLDRGEKIELLVDKTEGLAGDAFRFKKQSTRYGPTCFAVCALWCMPSTHSLNSTSLCLFVG